MKRDFSKLRQQPFDVIVIGGGIIGCGIARDASLRGYSTLLVEKEDFGCGTTSRSTRLIHGGLRYLRMLEFKLVQQDLHEREVLLQIAPHLVKPLEFVIPLLKSHPLYRYSLPPGLALYDLMAPGKSLPSHRRFNSSDTQLMEPDLSNSADLAGSLLFYDCQAQNMERLCLENAISAESNGAVILNYAQATEILVHEGVVRGILLRDCLSQHDYEVQGRIVVNAAGPWTSQMLEKVKLRHQYKLRLTKGIHLLTRKLTEHALVLFARKDGRLFFVIPWRGYSLIGTTDTEFTGNPDEVWATREDVDYLIQETRQYFLDFCLDDIFYTMAGLRPLVSEKERAASNVSRAHRLIDHEKTDYLPGLVSILGGKITAYRKIAEDTLDLIGHKFRTKQPCKTAQTPLPGAPHLEESQLTEIASEYQLPTESISHLERLYGSRLFEVLRYVKADPTKGSPITTGHPDILAQVIYSVEEEAALTLNDFMLRRSLMGLEPDQGLPALENVTKTMAGLLGWNSEQVEKQFLDYQSSIELTHKYRE